MFSGIGLAKVNAQGCSDAGFCSAGSLQNGQAKHETLRSAVAISAGAASGENNVMIFTPQLEVKIAGEKGYFEFKLPFQVISGDLGKNQGIGDLIASYTAPWKLKSKSIVLQETIGVRIGLGDANDENIGKPLPMSYQTSLGTTDLFVGVAMKWKKYLNMALAIQSPIIHYNNNGYDKMGYRGNDTSFFASRHLKRNGDVMLRIEGQYDFKKMGVTAGPQVIYHISDDKMKDVTGKESAIKGSAGLTLNVNASVYYKAKTWMLDLNAGVPVIQRDSRPDGLTRSWVAVPRITFFL
jgi:hypothetical protein